MKWRLDIGPLLMDILAERVTERVTALVIERYEVEPDWNREEDRLTYEPIIREVVEELADKLIPPSVGTCLYCGEHGMIMINPETGEKIGDIACLKCGTKTPKEEA